MKISLSRLSFLPIVTVLTVAGLLLASGQLLNAQSSSPAVTNISISTTSASATISFTVTPAAAARIVYGRTTSYGTNYPPNFDSISQSHSILLDGLSPSTTYHYKIEVKTDSGTTATADRSFTTASAQSGNTALILSSRGYDCFDDHCQINFSTNRPATTTMHWDTIAHPDYTTYANTEPGTTANAFVINGLTAGTEYHYRLRATAGSSVSATADLTFTTSVDPGIRSFNTGSCTIPGNPPVQVGIGACGPDGYSCENNGVVRQSCTGACGYTCPGGTTCRADGSCENNSLLNGSPYQCNKSSCYDGTNQLVSPVPGGCYSNWPRCNANTILKVRKDRGCNLWLTCATSLQTEPTRESPGENLCLSLAACNSLNQQGRCNQYLPRGQCNNDPLRLCNTDTDCEAGGSCNNPPADDPTRSLKDISYATPADVSKIANLSGNVVAGLDWVEQGGANVIQGYLPWQLMRQIGGDSQIINGDMEYRPPHHEGWKAVPEGQTPPQSLAVIFEDMQTSINHVLEVDPVTTAQAPRCSNDPTQDCSMNSAICGTGNTCQPTTVSVSQSGAATDNDDFTASPSEYYYAEARLRAPEGTALVRVQLKHGSYTQDTVTQTINNQQVSVPTYKDVQLTAAWQRVTLGPLSGLDGKTRFEVVCANATQCDKFLVDDVQIRSILQVSTNPTYVTPSCRLYPKADAPSCDYADANGIIYKGWHGYCLEHDSVTGTCLSWWPVDIIKGESSVFGSDTPAGYQDRTPLFLCAEAAGNNKGVEGGAAPQPYVTGKVNYNASRSFEANCSPAVGNFTIGQCCTTCIDGANQNLDRITKVNSTGPEKGLREDEILQVVWEPVTAGDPEHTPQIKFINNDKFRGSSRASPAEEGDYWEFHYRMWRDAPPYEFPFISEPANYIIWRWETDPGDCHPSSNGNCVTARLFFDKDTREFLFYQLIVDDQTDSPFTSMMQYRVHFYTRESCNKVVQVVTPNGAAQVYASRVNSNVERVPTLEYTKATDLAPFGGILAPEAAPEDPTQWPLLSVEQPNFNRFSVPGQSRAGTPYACSGTCTRFVCTEDWSSCDDGNGNLDPNKVTSCHQNDTSGDGEGGQCIGVTHVDGTNPVASAKGPQSFGGHDPEDVDTNTTACTDNNPQTVCDALKYFAQERIRRIFVKSFAVWEWENDNYVRQSIPDPNNPNRQIDVTWEPPDTLCPQNQRPAFPKDYCAIPPKIENAKFLAGTTTATVTGGSGSVAISFNSQADAEQVPLENFIIDWGDSQDTFAYPYAPRNDPTKPHVISHVYVLNRGDSRNCSTTNGRTTCMFPIKIQVRDNWGWCNDKNPALTCRAAPVTMGNGMVDSTNWFDTGLRVNVQP